MGSLTKETAVGKLVIVMMYILWVLTIIAILATTFKRFEYEDLNAIAAVLFVFAVINSFFAVKK